MKNYKKMFVFILTLSFFVEVKAAIGICDHLELLETMPILQGGRVKPLYVHASETLKYLTGKNYLQLSHGEKIPATKAYCLLSVMSNLTSSFDSEGSEQFFKLLKTKIEHVNVQKFFHLGSGNIEMAFEDLAQESNAVRIEAQNKNQSESYQKAMRLLLQNLMIYQEIKSGQNWMLPIYDSGTQESIVWKPLAEIADQIKVDSFFANAQAAYQKINGDKYLIELRYAKAQLPAVAMGLTLLALFFLVLVKKLNMALIVSGISLLTQIVLIVFRVYISGRAPITNMYETVLFSGTGALLLGLVLGHFKKEKTFVYMGLCYNFCTLMMINFAHGMLSPVISPLVPVLRDNFWLSTHVTTIILSYGALALSWILANTLLIKKRLQKLDAKEEQLQTEIIYTTLKWGTTMLAAGIILGGVWADYSWGRFWGWDPKETWSLIVLCIYMAILHGRYTSWIRPARFILVTALAFLSVMMAWFGVNYILASGLHSYGFSEGGAVFLGTFFFLQISVALLTLKPKTT